MIVREHLLELIDTREPGTAVPTERSLTTQLSTFWMNVRHAVMDLVSEGRLIRRQGSGTFAADAKITWPLHLASFTVQARANTSAPLLVVRRHSFDQERQPVEWAPSWFRGDRITFVADLNEPAKVTS